MMDNAHTIVDEHILMIDIKADQVRNQDDFISQFWLLNLVGGPSVDNLLCCISQVHAQLRNLLPHPCVRRGSRDWCAMAFRGPPGVDEEDSALDGSGRASLTSQRPFLMVWLIWICYGSMDMNGQYEATIVTGLSIVTG